MTFLEIIDHKEIDSIIDDAKASGLYTFEKLNVTVDDSCQRTTDEIESDEETQAKPVRSDSEVTLIRVNRHRFSVPKPINKWANIHDKAVPGDGTHLGESPSLVNLVTFINSDLNLNKGFGEYLVPLSTWDPTHLEEIHRSLEISGLSNSRLNIPYMMKQKLALRPGALFSQNNVNKTEVEDTKELQLIKPPPIVETSSRRGKFLRWIRFLCPCCREPRDDLIDMGVQTSDPAPECLVN